MFTVIFEVRPKAGHWDDYFANAAILRPELEGIDGFIENVRYRSLTRDGWVLSLSMWRNEKSLVRWRTRMRHHEKQLIGRNELFADYHLRVGEITADSQPFQGQPLIEHRFDETEVGEGTTVTLIYATRPPQWKQTNNPYDCAEWLGLNPWMSGSTSWDIYDAMLTPGDLLLLISWENVAAATAYEQSTAAKEGARQQRVRVIRDYSKYDRREAPQYYPDIPNPAPN